MSTQKILAGALVAQVALAALTWWPRGSADVEAKELVPGGGNGITAIEIVGSGEGATPVKLESKDGHWSIASAHGFPADDAKVAEVVDAVGKIKLKEPIATQPSSFEALGVTDGKFERKVTVTTAGGPITFLVGSADSKAIHLRPEGRDEVYKVKGLSAWTFKDAAKGYQPANYVELDKDAITALTIANAKGTVELAKTDAGWTLGGAAPGPADAAKVGKLLEAVAHVRLGEVVGTEVTPEQGLSEGAVRVTWTVKDGEASTPGGLVIGAEQGSNHYAKSDASSFVVLAPSYKLKDLIEADPATLVGSPVATAEGDPAQLLQGMPQGY
jgi:hypothetical protein